MFTSDDILLYLFYFFINWLVGLRALDVVHEMVSGRRFYGETLATVVGYCLVLRAFWCLLSE